MSMGRTAKEIIQRGPRQVALNTIGQRRVTASDIVARGPQAGAARQQALNDVFFTNTIEPMVDTFEEKTNFKAMSFDILHVNFETPWHGQTMMLTLEEPRLISARMLDNLRTVVQPITLPDIPPIVFEFTGQVPSDWRVIFPMQSLSMKWNNG